MKNLDFRGISILIVSTMSNRLASAEVTSYIPLMSSDGQNGIKIEDYLKTELDAGNETDTAQDSADIEGHPQDDEKEFSEYLFTIGHENSDFSAGIKPNLYFEHPRIRRKVKMIKQQLKGQLGLAEFVTQKRPLGLHAVMLVETSGSFAKDVFIPSMQKFSSKTPTVILSKKLI